MRMGAVMMRLSNLTLTSPAVTGLIMVTVLVLGAIVVRVVTVSEHGDVPTHIARDQGILDQGPWIKVPRIKAAWIEAARTGLPWTLASVA